MKAVKKSVYNFRLKRLQTFFKKNKFEKPAIVISGSPRGGTTWLFEVLQKTTPVFGIWEPLHPEIIQEYYPTKTFTFHKYIDPFTKENELFPNLNDITNVNFISTRLLQQNTKFKTYKNQELLLVKCCRLSPMLPWFDLNFRNNKVLQLYRNPLAVVSSQMKHGAWNTFSKKHVSKLVNNQNYTPEYYEQFQAIFDGIIFPEEVLAATWALDMIPTLNYDSKNVFKLKYEELFSNPELNFAKIYEFFDLKLPDNLSEIIRKPSSTTKQGSNILDNPEKQLLTWKKHLNEEQAERVRAILSKFGFNHIGDIEYSLKLDREVRL